MNIPFKFSLLFLVSVASTVAGLAVFSEPDLYAACDHNFGSDFRAASHNRHLVTASLRPECFLPAPQRGDANRFLDHRSRLWNEPVCNAFNRTLVGGDSTPLPNEPYYTIVPRMYCCVKAGEKITVDGRMDETAWRRADWTANFVDIEGATRPMPRYNTRVKLLWDQTHFYFFAEMEEPHVWGTLTKRDAVIFHDNDFEIFLSPSGDNHNYYEFEMNALNTVWDLFLLKPYRDGGPADNGWDIKGLKSAVQVRGTLNNASDTDEGWSVEVAIPWSAFNRHGEGKAPAVSGRVWRVNFSRVQWQHRNPSGRYEKILDTKEDNWVWSPQGVVDMHRPEKWGWVRFVDSVAKCSGFEADKHYTYVMGLHRLYWLQKDFHKKNKCWAKSAEELGVNPEILRIGESVPTLTATFTGFKVEYSVLGEERMDRRTWIVLGIDQESMLSRRLIFEKFNY